MPDHSACPRFHHAVELVGARWSGVIIHALLAGHTRFGEIKTAAGVSDTMLTRRLRELQNEGLIEREVLPSTPVTVEYRLTQKGRDIEPVIATISAWADKWLPDTGPADPAC